MNNRIIVILAVAVVIVAAGASITYSVIKNEDDKDVIAFGDQRSDYTLLDSDSKIVKGLTLRTILKSDGFNYDRIITVTDVDGDTLSIHELTNEDVNVGLSYFKPGESGVWKLDYTGDSPDPNLTISTEP